MFDSREILKNYEGRFIIIKGRVSSCDLKRRRIVLSHPRLIGSSEQYISDHICAYINNLHYIYAKGSFLTIRAKVVSYFTHGKVRYGLENISILNKSG